MKKETYEKIFSDTFQDALHDFTKNPIHNIFGKSPISYIADFCESDEFFKEHIRVVFSELTDFPCTMVVCDDRETLYTKFHSMRLSEQIDNLVEEMKKKETPHPDEMNNFVQVFLLSMVQCLLENMSKS
ncbi:hypothetical protein DPMN_187589 [Dreissena polymorpha]|uniref:Uncharacterized protein n=1 Tax=Dreissena polymorpha TaxID=45954 RepID=A0A9D4DRW2_DREPO|nr:hypothetical protein DPMN_187589 [Dreissena polymorpha]